VFCVCLSACLSVPVHLCPLYFICPMLYVPYLFAFLPLPLLSLSLSLSLCMKCACARASLGVKSSTRNPKYCYKYRRRLRRGVRVPIQAKPRTGDHASIHGTIPGRPLREREREGARARTHTRSFDIDIYKHLMRPTA
jgi:hypothetical protein